MPVPPILVVSLNSSFDRAVEVPGLTLGDHARGRLLSVQPAGKGVNVARILATLGTPCTLAGFVGDGDRERFERSLQGLPVHVELLETRSPTRQNTTLIDPAAGRETHIREAGSPVSPEDLDSLARQMETLASPQGYVVFAGSLPPEMPPESLVRLIDLCQARGARVAVDTSGPGLEAVRQSRRLWLIKPNRDEFAELRSPHPPRDAAEIVAVTLGADGARLFTRDGAWHGRLAGPSPRPIVKTVGCGDAFLAGFLHSHSSGAPLPDCLRHALACGTASAYQVRTGEIDVADVQACLENVALATE
jgi:1-phosphofructokinase